MPDNGDQSTDPYAFVRESSVYQNFLAEREEIMKHRWNESKRLGEDIGFERALVDWVRNHKKAWQEHRSCFPR